MEKKTFLDIFKDHDKNYISSIYEDIELCKKHRNSYIYKGSL